MANAPESAQRLVFLDIDGVFTVRADTRSNIAATPAGRTGWGRFGGLRPDAVKVRFADEL
jgi:hypothetical protein